MTGKAQSYESERWSKVSADSNEMHYTSKRWTPKQVVNLAASLYFFPASGVMFLHTFVCLFICVYNYYENNDKIFQIFIWTECGHRKR